MAATQAIPATSTPVELLEANFKKLKGNREKVPMEELRTRYGKAYSQLLNTVEACRREYEDQYFRACLGALPYYGDEAAALEIIPRWDAIKAEEHRPGGLYDQQRAALFDRLDLAEYYRLTNRLIDRFCNEAYGPYADLHRGEAGQ